MSFKLVSKRTQQSQAPRWSGAAFIVEALLLLVFLATAAAIFVQLFAHSAEKSAESIELSKAVAVASNTAERFAADPASVSETEIVDGLIVKCTTSVEERTGGNLHHATISVYRADTTTAGYAGEAIYTLDTARYEPGGAS